MITIDFQVTCSKVKVNHSSKPSLLSGQYLLTTLLDQYQTWCRGCTQISRWSLLIFMSHVQRSKSNHSWFWAQCVVCLISFDPFTWWIPNLVQGLYPISRWSLLISRSHVQRLRSKYSFESSVLSTLYVLISCLVASDRFCFYGEDKSEFCTMGYICFWNISCFYFILIMFLIFCKLQSIFSPWFQWQIASNKLKEITEYFCSWWW